MTGSELELKVSLPPGEMQTIGAAAKRLAAGPSTRRQLRSIYFDTDDFRLHERRIAVRVRRVEGRWVQTIKIGQGLKHGLSNPREIEHDVDGPEPDLAQLDKAIRRAVERAAGGTPLRAVFETVFWRTALNLETESGGVIEAAFDRGQIIAGEASEPVNEIELELKSGPPHALLSVAETLFDGRPTPFSTGSKASRGVALARGEAAAAPAAPATGRKPTLRRGQTAAEALAAVGAAAAEQALDNWRAVLATDEPEGPHQLRVGLRRLRTALRMFEPVFDSPELDALARDAKALGQVVGALRDADVLMVDIIAPVAARQSAVEGIPALKAAVDSHRVGARRALRESLEDPGWSRFRLNCAMFDLAAARVLATANAATARRKARPIARLALENAWRKARRKARDLDSLTTEERHDLRKALKTLRYSAEFCAALYPGSDSGDFIKRLKKLQTVFGYLNDVAAAESLPAIAADQGATDAAVASAIGAVLAWHQARADAAWKSALKRWSELENAPRFWE